MPSIIRIPSAWIKYNGSLITDANIPAGPTWSTGQVSFRSTSYTRPSMELRFLMQDVEHTYPFYPTFTDGWYSQENSARTGHLTEEQINTLNNGSSVIITTSQLVLNMNLTYEPTKLYVTLSSVGGSQGGDISVYWSGKPVGSSISWYLGSITIPSRTYGTFGINASPRPLT